MVKTRHEVEEVIKKYLSKLGEMGIAVERVILFGSYAKGLAREESDIDLIIVSRDFEGMNLRERLEILGIAAARIMQPIQSKGYTPDEIESKDKNQFLQEALENSKHLTAP